MQLDDVERNLIARRAVALLWRRLVLVGALLLSVVVPVWLVAANVAVPHTFADGEVAVAADVNANFTELQSAINRYHGTPRPGFLAYVNSVGPFTGTRVIKGTDYDSPYGSPYSVGTAWDPDTGVFTAPVTGRYLIVAHVMPQTGTTILDAYVRNNGHDILRTYSNDPDSHYKHGSMSAIVRLQQNDKVTLELGGGSIYQHLTWWGVTLFEAD